MGKLAGVDAIQYVEAHAEDFKLQCTYPIITVVRAWHWFDRIKVIENIKAHLEPNGHLLVINSIFKPDSKIARLTFEVLMDNNIELKPSGSNVDTKDRRNGFPVNWFDEWKNNSFLVVDEWQHEYELKFTHEQWCGKLRSISWLANIEEETRITFFLH
ncbi:hypothetical protein Back11_13840 [Paenibacillus baekrokdamisoli]|uniref:Uncharacterized protein n=2 Tax=Paenibacillus baekrokdamisoli TaxID=1712516 RepID=A0A3G9JAK2_9BACL|nr:SAM-dependent methyltransferase [Paenibacillus baekrokdamisoli]BBH20039.1 hypothetical protein Back11_13840 [Paenibacillus baekrokdamisoli]